MTDEVPTHDEIDELAVDIETTIQETEQFLESLPDFDSKYRRIEEAQAQSTNNVMEMFS